MLRRNIEDLILTSLHDTPVVFIQGPRQAGKSTLVQSLDKKAFPAEYYTLDDAATLAAATSDPQGFIAQLPRPAIIDEVQRAAGLPLAIKKSVDSNRAAGQFLLTGSTNAMVTPTLAESLAGRMELHTLWPLSQGELAGRREMFIDAAFNGKLLTSVGGDPWPALAGRMAVGGYPEMLGRSDNDRRRAWLGAYITTILQRDVRDIADIRDVAEMPRLLALLAARSASLLNYADLARSLPIAQTTLKRYMALLQATFLMQTLPPWFVNKTKRLVRAPKTLIVDTGLLCYLLNMDAQRLQADRAAAGAVLENFVAMELFKQRGWSRTRPELFHFRTETGDEVDLVLEDRAGRIVGIEVKATGTIAAAHFKGLHRLAALAADRFHRGIVLYTGDKVVPFGGRMFAAPIGAIWNS